VYSRLVGRRSGRKRTCAELHQARRVVCRNLVTSSLGLDSACLARCLQEPKASGPFDFGGLAEDVCGHPSLAWPRLVVDPLLLGSAADSTAVDTGSMAAEEQPTSTHASVVRGQAQWPRLASDAKLMSEGLTSRLASLLAGMKSQLEAPRKTPTGSPKQTSTGGALDALGWGVDAVASLDLASGECIGRQLDALLTTG
jgi:hypothetical protein